MGGLDRQILAEKAAAVERHLARVAERLPEDREQIERMRGRPGRTSIELLDDLGVLDERMLAAHLDWPTEEEIDLLARRGVGVAHCPESNMKITSGIDGARALGMADEIGSLEVGERADLILVSSGGFHRRPQPPAANPYSLPANAIKAFDVDTVLVAVREGRVLTLDAEEVLVAAAA